MAEDGAGAGRRRVQIGGARHHHHSGLEPEVLGHVGLDGSQDAAGRDQRGQLLPGDARRLHQDRVVGEAVGTPVVGEPGPGHRSRRGRGHPREAHGEVVDRFEVPTGGLRHLGLSVLEEQHVTDGVGTRRGGGAATVPDPTGQGQGGIATDRSPHRLPDQVGAPGVEPHEAGSDRPPIRAHGYGARPLPGAGDGHDAPHRYCAGADGPSGRRGDQAPPHLGILGDPAVVAVVGRDGLVLRPGDHAGERDQPHLGSARAQIDGEDEAVFGGGARCHQAGCRDGGAVGPIRRRPGWPAGRPSCRPSPP